MMCQRVSVPIVTALTVVVLVLLVPGGRACPRSCNCYQASEVHCTFRSLLSIPPGLPAQTLRINLGFNSISRIPDNSLAGLKRAELLMLHGNDIHQIPDGAFRDMKSLQILKLSYNKLREISSSQAFSGLTSLLRLHLDHNHLQYLHPQALLQTPSLRLLRLQGNRLHQLHPRGLCTLSLLNTYFYSTLRHLDLSNNSITTLPRETLETAPLLETLVLQANPWSCDCRMNWFSGWALAHPGLMKCPKGPQCPVCESPDPLRGRGLLQQTDLSCAAPVISFAGRDPPSEVDHGSVQPIESFIEPLGTASLGLSDQQGNNVDLSCDVTHSANTPDITPLPDLSLSSSAPLSLSLSLSLECPVERGSYETLWRILAYYSETAVRLEREIMLSKAPDLSYRYRQAGEREGYYHTGVRASIKAKPQWLLQPSISIQLNRAQSSGNRLQLILTTRASARPDPVPSSSSSQALRPWVLIPTNHSVTALAAVAGSRVELTCPILSSGKPTVIEWNLPDGTQLFSPSSSPDGRAHASASGLLIQKTELSDSGMYYCVARAGRDVDVLQVRLAVEQSSVAIPGEQVGPSLTGMVGEAMTLPCVASGSPMPDISWVLPDGSIVRQGSGRSNGLTIQSNGSLSLPRSSMNDAGQYRCTAVNQYGADSLSTQLKLNPRPSRPLLTSLPRGPQSAAGRSTRIRAPLLQSNMVEEGSGDEEEEERNPSAGRRRTRPHQPSLNRRYPAGHPRRRVPVRAGVLRRGSGGPSSVEPRRNHLDNRRRVSSTKQKIDPQKWADLLAKIRDRTALNSTSQSNSVEEPTDRGRDEDESSRDRVRGEGERGEEKEAEGSSIDDASLQEEGLHPVHTEVPTHRQTKINTQTDTGTETERNVDTEREQESDLQVGRSTETQTERVRENEAEKDSQTELQIDPVTSRTNEIVPEPVEEQERESIPNPIEPRPQNPRQGRLPNSVPNSRPQSPWNARRRIGQRRRINRPRGRPLTPRPRPLPVLTTPQSHSVAADTTVATPSLAPTSSSSTMTLAKKDQIKMSSAAPDELEFNSPPPAISYSVPLSPTETPFPSLSPSTPPVLYSSSSPAQTTSPPMTHRQDTLTHSVNMPDSVAPGTVATLTPPRAHTTMVGTPPSKHTDGPPSKHAKEMEWNLLGESDGSSSLSPSSSDLSTVPSTATTTVEITTTPSVTPIPVTSIQATSTARITTVSPKSKRKNPIATTITTTTSTASPTTTTRKTTNPIIIIDTITTTTTARHPTSSTSKITTYATMTTTTNTPALPSTTSATTTLPPPPPPTTTTPTTTTTATPTTPTTTTTTTAAATTTTTTTTLTTLPTTTTTTPLMTTTTPTAPITSTGPTIRITAPSISTSTTPVTTTTTTPTTTSTTREASRQRPSLERVDHRGVPDSGVPEQSRPPPSWKNPGVNSIPDSHGSRPRPPLAPSLPASPGSSAARPAQTKPLAPQVPVLRSRPRIADPHIRTVSVPAESTASLACETKGEPKPTITWTKVSTGAVMSVHSRTQRFEVLPNGTFVINNVQMQDRGTYICSAQSSLGRDRMLTTLEVWSRPPRMQLANYREATIHQGGELHLDCQADGVPAPLLSWVLPDRSVKTSTDSSHGRMTMHANGTLHISAVLLSDRGVYRCVASNSAGAASSSVRMHVSSLPPVIHQPREDRLVLTLGMPLYAHCSARGAPPPTLRWRIPDGTLVRTSQFLHGNLFVLPNGTLHIRKLGPKDSGSYECTATNAVGADKRTVRVELAGWRDGQGGRGGGEGIAGGATSTLPPQPPLSGGGSSLPASPSRPVNTGKLSPPPSPLDRSRTPTPSSSNSPDSPPPPRTPYSNNPSPKSNVTGNISPVHSSPLPPSSPLSPAVSVNNTRVSPSTVSHAKAPAVPVSALSKARITSTSPSVTMVHYGGFLQLHCSASGNPLPSVIWRTPHRKLVDVHFSFDRRLKVHPNGSLSVQTVTEKDAGDYLCIARNKVADDYRLLRVSVATKPARIEPKQPSNQMVEFGGPLKVDCLASGLPDPAVRWSLPDGTMVNSVLQGEERGGRTRRLTVFDNGTLLVPAVGMGEEGEYTCYAENQGGQDTMKIKVKVMMNSPPTFTDVPDYDVVKVRQGATAVIRCKAKANPAPTITWFSPNNRVIPRSLGSRYFSERVVVVSEGTLEVRLAQKSDAGNYTCRASNVAGVRSRVVGLQVELPNYGMSGSTLTVGVHGRGSSSTSSSSTNSGSSHNSLVNVNTGQNGDSYNGFSNGGTGRFGSNGAHGSSTSSSSSGIGVNKPINGVTTQLGSSVFSVGGNGANNIAIRPGQIVHLTATNGNSNSAISANSPTGIGAVSGGLGRTNINEVNGKASNGASVSTANGRPNSATGNTDVINSGPSNGAGTSIVSNNGLSRTSNTGETSSTSGTNNNNGRISVSTSNSGTSTVSNSTNTVVSAVTSVKQRAVKGQTVMLPCPSHGSPPPRLSWFLPGNGILPAPYYGSRLTVHRNGSLELRGVRMSDTGTLVCVVRGERGESRIHVELEVSETQAEPPPHRTPAVERPPPLRTPAVERPASRGSGLSDTSNSAGLPAIPLWSHSGGPPQGARETARPQRPVTERPFRPFIPVHAPRSDVPSLHSGGTVSEQVKHRPQPVVVNTKTGSLVSIINGETLRLSCSAPQVLGNVQGGSLSWTLPSGEVLSRGESSGSGRYSVHADGTLTVQQASVFDRGSYSCRTTNHDSSSAATIMVPVIVIAYPPRITIGPSPVTYTRPGVAVEMSCLAIATPRATITWETPDRAQLRATGQARTYGNRYLSAQGSLIVQNPSSRDTGFYKCTARNVIGVDTKVTYLHVM